MLALSVGLVFLGTAYATVQAPVAVEVPNRNYTDPFTNTFSPRQNNNLFQRQSNCYSPNRYCALYNKCCSSAAAGCCPFGCTGEFPNECCFAGDFYCTTGKQCCNTGCMPAGSQCCKSGGYCPQPFLCVLYNGQPGCCTDLTCRVYLSDGITKTAIASQTVAPGPVATTPRATTPYVTPAATTPYSTGAAVTGIRYYTYTTTFYWYYWYYYYTISYYPITYTTRTITTVTRTTRAYCSATDTYAAALSFSDTSANLPTPTYALVVIPATPTVGAIVIGSCSGGTYSTVTDSSGNPSSTYVSLCQTVTADGRGTYSSVTSGGSGASSTGSGFSGGGGSGAAGRTLSWVMLVASPVVVGLTMILL